MELVKESYNKIKSVASNIIEEVENAVYLYIEQYFINENLDLQGQINYADSSYKFKLQTILNTIINAIESIGFNKEIIATIRSKYKEFLPRPEYTTYIDWLINEFQPLLAKIIGENFLSFLASSDKKSLITNLADFELINRNTLDKIILLRTAYPEFVQFIGWYFDIKNAIQNKIQTISSDLQTVFRMEKMERDLQSIYYIYNIFSDFKFDYNIPDIVKIYLKEKINDWSQRNPNIDERYPLVFYIGAKLTKSLNAGLDSSEIKRYLQQFLMNLVNKNKCPLFQETFLTHYIVLTCGEMGLKLSPKLITGLTRYSHDDFSDTLLENLSTYQLYLIYETYKLLNVESELSNELRLKIKNIISSRLKNGVPLNLKNDIIPTVHSIMAGLKFYESINALNELSLVECLKSVLSVLRNAKIGLDFTITSTLADIHEGINVIEWYIKNENVIVKQTLSKFLLHKDLEESAITQFNAENYITEKDLFDEAGWQEEPKTQQIQPDYQQVVVQQPIVKKVSLLPQNFYEFFGRFPILNPDILDLMKVNLQGLSNFRDQIFSDLSVLHQWIVVHRIANIQIPFDSNLIYQKTAPYRLANGFSGFGLDYPDSRSTFYGLSIYEEMALLSRLDLNAIYLVLMEEAKNMEISALYTNPYIFSSLRILERHGIAIDFQNFRSILNKMVNYNILQSNDMVEFFPDIFYHVTLIKTIDPNAQYPMIDEFFNELKSVLHEDGSIKNSPTVSAMILCTMFQLGYHASEEGKLIMKYLQLNVEYFDSSVELMPPGLGWASDFEGYRLELNLLYWSLVALTLMYPMERPDVEAITCPSCGKYFEKRPKFCNGCGTKL